jgi:hypothetical protein
MSALTIADVGQIASVLAAVVAIGIAIKTYKRQHNVETFLHYTDRYQSIMAKLPPWARMADADAPPHASNDEVRMACLSYLNMCAEEHFLYRKRYLAEDVWAIWKAEMIRALRTPLLRTQWEKLGSEFTSDKEFTSFVQGILAGPEGVSPAAQSHNP